MKIYDNVFNNVTFWNLHLTWNLPNVMKSARFHMQMRQICIWNLPDFIMKSAGFHGLPLNAVFFMRYQYRWIHYGHAKYAVYKSCGMKSAWFHEIHLISWNLPDFMAMKSTRSPWNPPDFMAMKSAKFHLAMKSAKFHGHEIWWPNEPRTNGPIFLY